MAKLGEGDPRWIVDIRPDATNVNNWHWKESNATNWSKDKLNDLLLNFEITEDNLFGKLIEFEKLEGEATANNRKGKLIYFYEWNLVLKWEGKVLNDDSKIKVEGKITIPNLSEENSIDEIDIQVNVNETNEKSEIVKQFMYTVGRKKIREQINKYILCLQSDYAKNLILPKKDDGANKVAPVTQAPKAKVKAVFNESKSPSSTSNDSKPLGVKIDVKTLAFNEKFQCKASALYDALTRKELVTAFTRGDVNMEFKKGGEFSFFGGNISGKFIEIVENKKIVQSWRYKQWPAGHYSNVEMEFEEKDDHTLLKIIQTLVPSTEYDTTNQNWQRYYFESIRATFGFGSFLY
ncbi:unnamed protein product [Diamesa hyperborea]